jgi:tripeptide aminopeptidase
MISRDRLIKTFTEMVQIDSPSGEEEAMAQYVISKLEKLGLNVSRDAYGNVIANDGGEDPLLLSAHIDTVEPGRGIKPLIKGDKIVSDGSTILGGDCKAGVAAILEAIESVTEDNTQRRSIEIAFTREEELGLLGARNLNFSMLKSDTAIVFDGEGPSSQITSASPTYISFDIDVIGRSAHAGVEPEKGLSAIKISADLISKLPQGRLDEETTFNVGRIDGGSTRNSVAEKVSIQGEFRSRSTETLEILKLQITETINDILKVYPDAVINNELQIQFQTYTLTDEDKATNLVKIALKSMGMQPEMLPSGGGTDGNVFRLNGISAVVVGMADHNMHTKREYVIIPDLIDSANLCETLLIS